MHRLLFILLALAWCFPVWSSAQLAITEFMADNESGLLDEDGDTSDWIEICNLGAASIDLAGYALSDDSALVDRWLIPSVTLSGGSCVVIFASGKDRDDPDAELHTDFKLSKDGEYLGVIAPDGITEVHAFRPAFPQQFPDISYGMATTAIQSNLVSTVRVLVPSDGALSNRWVQTGFDDAAWTSGAGGVGFNTSGNFDAAIGVDLDGAMRGVNPTAYLRFPFTVPDASEVHGLRLRVKYDDGFIGYLNGQPTVERNAPVANEGVDQMLSYTVQSMGSGVALDRVSMVRGGRTWEYGTNDLIGVTLIHFKAGSARNNTIGLSAPAPAAGDRHKFIDEDFLLTTGIINPGGAASAPTSDPVIDHGTPANSTPGMAIMFDQPVTNSAGDDVIFFELDNTAPEGDAFHVMPLSGLTGGGRNALRVSNYDVPFTGASLIGSFQQFNYNPAPQSLDALENAALSVGTFSSGFSAPGTGIDLSDLGVPLDGTVNGLFIMAVGTNGGIDPVLIAGLPPISGTGDDWRLAALSDRDDALALQEEVIELTADRDLLQTGNNLLAIHGMSAGINDTNFLISLSLEQEIRSFDTNVVQFFTTDTPGLPNEDGQVDLGPYILGGTDAWTELETNFTLTVTAEVAETSFAVRRVEVFYRVMYTGEVAVAMADDGIAPDAVAGDGLYTAALAGDLLPGNMLRWRFEAEDSDGRIAEFPTFDDPLNRDRYFGTIAHDPSIDSLIPVLHWFLLAPGDANSRSPGERGSAYFLGRFYDNMLADLHGQSSGGFPKKSYDLDFNKGNRFVWKEGEGKVRDINLITNWGDKSKTRNTLGYEVIREAGAPAHFAFPVRVHQNGAFFSIADMIEDGDDDFLERVGLDPDGALYKMYNNLSSATTGAEKKSRRQEGSEDLQALIDGLTTGTAAEQIAYAYDHVDIAACANYYAMQTVYGNHDFGHKNYYLYRDSEGSGEWMPINWDVDLSLGHRWNSTDNYFDDTLLFNNGVNIGVGSNRLRQDLYAHAPFYQMFARRMRTLLDQFLQPPGTAMSNRYYEARLDELADLLDPTTIVPSDQDLDFAKWGTWKDQTDMRTYIQRMKDEFFEQRRNYLYITNSVHNGGIIPDAQAAFCPIEIDAVDFLPAGGDQGEEYIRLVNTNAFAVDLSGWAITGAVTHAFTPGTVLPAFNASVPDESRIYVVRDRPRFRSRGVSPTGGELRFVQGDYEGQLSARGETIYLINGASNLVDSLSYAGTPTELQVALRVTELNYHPADPTAAEQLAMPEIGNKDFEYIELMNIGTNLIDLSGAAFVEGVTYTFPSNSLLAVGERVVVVHNLAAFALRYGTNELVVGNFMGNLDNRGERIRLQDAVGENILSFSYDQDWQPASDGGGQSLTIVDPGTSYEDWGVSNRWRSSGKFGGSPGWDDSSLADIDRDGMADSWEVLHLGGTNAVAHGDGDFDKLSNLHEYIAGTQPDSGASLLGVEVSRSNGVERISLQTLPAVGVGYERLERFYTIEATTDLQLPFTPVAGFDRVLGTGQVLVHSNTAEYVTYYRGRVELR